MHTFPCSIVFDRLARNGRMYEEVTTKHLNEYGEVGLRTLALAYKKLEEDKYAAWNEEFIRAKTAIGGDREAMLDRVADMMEKDFILVGATAVEDKLQNGVWLISYQCYESIDSLSPSHPFPISVWYFCVGAPMHRQTSTSWSKDLGSDR